MKLKNTIAAFALFISPFALVSCGDGEKKDTTAVDSAEEDTAAGDVATADSEDGGSAEASAKSHMEIGQEMAGVMSEMMTGMSSIKDVASAEAFAAAVPDLKAKMKDLLTSAKALPAPTEEEKVAVTKMMDDVQEKAGPAIMEAMMGMSENPDAEAIGKVMEAAMQDEEMDKVGTELEAMYKTEGAEEVEFE